MYLYQAKENYCSLSHRLQLHANRADKINMKYGPNPVFFLHLKETHYGSHRFDHCFFPTNCSKFLFG